MTKPMTDERLKECREEALLGGADMGGWGAVRAKVRDCVREIDRQRDELEDTRKLLDVAHQSLALLEGKSSREI